MFRLDSKRPQKNFAFVSIIIIVQDLPTLHTSHRFLVNTSPLPLFKSMFHGFTTKYFLSFAFFRFHDELISPHQHIDFCLFCFAFWYFRSDSPACMFNRVWKDSGYLGEWNRSSKIWRRRTFFYIPCGCNRGLSDGKYVMLLLAGSGRDPTEKREQGLEG